MELRAKNLEDSKIKCNYGELVELHKLIPNPKNPNKHPDEQIKRLSEIIDYQGMRSPIVVSNRSGFITKGHGRLEALRLLGWEKAPIDYQDYDSDAQEFSDLVADNAIAEWAAQDLSEINLEMLELGPDFDIDLLGIKDFVIEPVEKYDEEKEDDVPDIKHDPITKKGDVWLLGEHRVMCGDSTMIDDVEKLMNGEKADMVFTSPPYSDMRDYNGDKDLAISSLVDFIPLFKPIAPMMVVNLGIQRKNGEINSYWDEYIEKARESGYLFSSWNVWNREGKGGSIGNMTAQFPIEHEWIFVFSDSGKKINRTKDNVSCKKIKSITNRNKDGSTTSKRVNVSNLGKIGTVSTFDFDRFTGGERNHPAQFPVPLADHYIRACSKTSAIDPFCGSGSTLIACEKTNRKCYGMELDERYCDVICARWSKYTGKDPVLESTGEKFSELKEEHGQA